jgi:hypothetical protein
MILNPFKKKKIANQDMQISGEARLRPFTTKRAAVESEFDYQVCYRIKKKY